MIINQVRTHMLHCQKDLFDLPEEVSYLNCATLSPFMKQLAEVGKKAIDQRARPYEVGKDEWFGPSRDLKKSFAQLINCPEPERIALIPAVSYGMAIAAKNIKLQPNEEVLIVSEQFPSNYYVWHRLTEKYGAKLRVISPPKVHAQKGRTWNANILEAISDKTRVITIGNVYWTDGTLFQLEAISQKAKQHHALLIVDGSQSVGALPFDVQKIKPDLLVCAGYKWLFGPYSLGVAYFGDYFDGGIPLEESWINRKDSDNFQALVDYTDEYRPLAGRYDMGQSLNLQLAPVLNASIQQLLTWGVDNIQAYCKKITANPIHQLREMGCLIEEDAFRPGHLFGIHFQRKIDIERLQQIFADEQLYVSFRGSAIRISVNVYNDEADMEKLVGCIAML